MYYKKKKDLQYPCDNCEKPAVYNLQNVWQLYEIDNDEIEEEPCETHEGDSNEFYCADCYKREMGLTN